MKSRFEKVGPWFLDLYPDASMGFVSKLHRDAAAVRYTLAYSLLKSYMEGDNSPNMIEKRQAALHVYVKILGTAMDLNSVENRAIDPPVICD